MLVFLFGLLDCWQERHLLIQRFGNRVCLFSRLGFLFGPFLLFSASFFKSLGLLSCDPGFFCSLGSLLPFELSYDLLVIATANLAKDLFDLGAGQVVLLFEQRLLAFFQAPRQLASSEHELFRLQDEDLSQDGNSDGALLVLRRDLAIDDIRPGCVIAPICEENLINSVLGLLVRENYILDTWQFRAVFHFLF